MGFITLEREPVCAAAYKGEHSEKRVLIYGVHLIWSMTSDQLRLRVDPMIWGPIPFSAEQSVKLILDYSVALADGIFELLAIEDRNVAADVTNRTGIMQPSGSYRHTFTAYA